MMERAIKTQSKIFLLQRSLISVSDIRHYNYILKFHIQRINSLLASLYVYIRKWSTCNQSSLHLISIEFDPTINKHYSQTLSELGKFHCYHCIIQQRVINPDYSLNFAYKVSLFQIANLFTLRFVYFFSLDSIVCLSFSSLLHIVSLHSAVGWDGGKSCIHDVCSRYDADRVRMRETNDE